ncbi:MAG: GNAT family N-acetyltransferase [Candidatus Promineifilaceae bacterium]
MSELLNLPRDLGDGLVLRWATAEDAEALAEFNFRHHNDDPMGKPETWLKEWTRDLLDGGHPTTGPQDVTVVVDENDGGKIVSAVFLISQTWRYDDVVFGCGMPELVATDEAYRRRGLVRLQMDAIHALSQKKGELVQIIAGIPWYYRQFGYEMALDLGGGVRVPVDLIAALPESEKEQYHLRPAETVDLSDLKALYERGCERSLISCVRDDTVWCHEIEKGLERPVSHRHMEMIETAEGNTVGYVQIHTFPAPYQLNELEIYPGHSLRAVCLFLCRAIKAQIEETGLEKKPKILYFSLGQSHPAYDALGTLGNWRRPYARFVRVPDLSRFLLHIRPVLERRLAESVMAGHNGCLKLNFYTSQLKVDIEAGKITAVEPYIPDDFFDFDVFFPDLTFLQVLFGRRDLEELRHIYADCFPRNDESALLLKILFPKSSSYVINVN